MKKHKILEKMSKKLMAIERDKDHPASILTGRARSDVLNLYVYHPTVHFEHYIKTNIGKLDE